MEKQLPQQITIYINRTLAIIFTNEDLESWKRKKVHIFVVKFLPVFAYRFLHRHYSRHICHLRTFTLHDQCLKRTATRKIDSMVSLKSSFFYYFELQQANIFLKFTVTAQEAAAYGNKDGPSKSVQFLHPNKTD